MLCAKSLLLSESLFQDSRDSAPSPTWASNDEELHRAEKSQDRADADPNKDAPSLQPLRTACGMTR
jgi:hypothetical protein